MQVIHQNKATTQQPINCHWNVLLKIIIIIILGFFYKEVDPKIISINFTYSGNNGNILTRRPFGALIPIKCKPANMLAVIQKLCMLAG